MNARDLFHPDGDQMRPARLQRLLAIAALAATPAFVNDAAAQDFASAEEAARVAYEEGRCLDVLAILEEVERSVPEAVGGVSRYRIGFCSAALGRSDGIDHYGRAAEQLAAETALDGAPLGAHFYYVNALLNLQRADDAKGAAAEAVRRYESGSLTIPPGRPDEWFRLGKLYRDAGNDAGAVEPFGRALDVAEESGIALRDAYLQRISDGARAAGDLELAGRVAALRQAASTGGISEELAVARSLIAAGELKKANKALAALQRAPDDTGSDVQYALGIVGRALKQKKKGVGPADTLEDGKRFSALSTPELREAIFAALRDTSQILGQGEAVEVERKRFEGETKLVPPGELKEPIEKADARLTGLFLEAVSRGAPLRNWALEANFGSFVFRPVADLYLMNAERRAAAAAPAPPASVPNEEDLAAQAERDAKRAKKRERRAKKKQQQKELQGASPPGS